MGHWNRIMNLRLKWNLTEEWNGRRIIAPKIYQDMSEDSEMVAFETQRLYPLILLWFLPKGLTLFPLVLSLQIPSLPYFFITDTSFPHFFLPMMQITDTDGNSWGERKKKLPLNFLTIFHPNFLHSSASKKTPLELCASDFGALVSLCELFVTVTFTCVSA